MEPLIRAPRESEYAEWKRLWDQYLDFYEVALSEDHAAALWQRIHDDEQPIGCFVAQLGESLVGFTHYLPHADTWDDRPICYLQDLLVEPEHRGEGIGRALIDAVGDRAKERGWSTVYWLTAEDNVVARRLYDDVTGGASGFIMYQVPNDS